MQQNCAVHSCGVYWLALHYPHCPHKGQEQHGTQNGQTADCAPLLAAVVFMHSLFYQFDTLFCIVHAFQPPSTQTVLKVFHLYRYKKSEKLSPENQIFSKKFESCRNSSQKRKKGYIIVSNCGKSVFPLPGSVQAADKQYTVLHHHRRSGDYKLHER